MSQALYENRLSLGEELFLLIMLILCLNADFVSSFTMNRPLPAPQSVPVSLVLYI